MSIIMYRFKIVGTFFAFINKNYLSNTHDSSIFVFVIINLYKLLYMLISFIFHILEKIYPVYWEVTVINVNGTRNKHHYIDKNDAIFNYYRYQDDKNVSMTVLDKYINIQGHYLIKVGKEHKGRFNR